jgi:exopolysaccharide biosynthesis predicted pyruvyltransferase EpsI
MALYGPAYFEKLYMPLTGRRVGFYPLNGNVGDHLNHQATRQLFDYFEIEFEEIQPWKLNPDEPHLEVEELVISGGGNMGSAFYQVPFRERRIALKTGLPITVFPQTFVGNDEDLSGYKKIFVRERQSLALSDRFELAPDMAMGLGNVPPLAKGAEPMGVFLRRDMESRFSVQYPSLGDPAQLCTTWEEYLELAALFEHVITDRLHFAIAALLQNRRATLLPNSYFKNRAVFDTWLRDFECAWLDDPAAINFDPRPVADRMLHRLAAAPGKAVDWLCRPTIQPGYRMFDHQGQPVIRRPDSKFLARCNESTQIIWALCDGSRTVTEILETLLGLFPDDKLAVARDLQHSLGNLRGMEAIRLITAEPGHESRDRGSGAPVSSIRAVKLLEVDVDATRTERETIIRRATVSGAGSRARSIWFRYDNAHSPFANENADSFLLAVLMNAMRRGRDIVVRNAPVSAGLMSRLERFQLAWIRWRPELNLVDIRAESESNPTRKPPNRALLAFSGGVDSCFTAREYTSGHGVHHQTPVAAALMIHGFDMACDDNLDPVFARAADRSRNILNDVELPLVTVKTNTRLLCDNDWIDYHGLMLGAALSLFKAGFRTGIVPSTMPYEMMMPLGSNPVSDPLMSCDIFEITHHGSHASRMDKLGIVGRWEAAARNLRVCWQGPDPDRNCGHCRKCVVTHLGLWAHGLEAPCFDIPLGAELVRKALGNKPLALLDWLDVHSILISAIGNGLDAPWVPVLRYGLSIRH